MNSSASQPQVSLVIRCYNEERHIGNLLEAVGKQSLREVEVVVVDSGSTDRTLEIVGHYPVKLVQIQPDEFTFGRALNLGCAVALGEILVFASAHVVPCDDEWLEMLGMPFERPEVALVYGRQTGNEVTRFSEHQVFASLFPSVSDWDQKTPFCNNANAAIRRRLWEAHPFDEALTGLEDLEWGKWALEQGHRIAYETGAVITHIHEEDAGRIFRRYEREAIALRRIFPDSRMTILEMCQLLIHGVWVDLRMAFRQRRRPGTLLDILVFRTMQYVGTYTGLHHRSPVTHNLMMHFYYPGRRLDVG